MKVEIIWAKRNSNGSFSVKAKKLSDVKEELQSKGEWGKFSWSLDYSIDNDANGNAVKVRLTVGYDIEMPKWPAYKHQTQQVKDSWDEMWRALKKHENGHLSIFEENVERLKNEFEALNETKGGEIKKKNNDAVKEIQKKQDEYDVKTDHGKNQGVILNIP